MKKPRFYEELLRYITDDSINGFYANNFIKKDGMDIEKYEFVYKMALNYSVENIKEPFKNYPEVLDFLKKLIEARLKNNYTEPEKNNNEEILLAKIFVTDEIFEPIYLYILQHDQYYEEYINELTEIFGGKPV
jgi:hypothetical protein